MWHVGGIFVPQPGIKTTPLALEGKLLTAGPPGKSNPYILRGKGFHATVQAVRLSVTLLSPNTFLAFHVFRLPSTLDLW